MQKLFPAILLMLIAMAGLALAQPLNLAHTFQQQAPIIAGGKLGHSVAGMGNNALVGAPGALKAFLFDASTGAHMRTFVNFFAEPEDPDNFGFAVAMMNDNVLIGAPLKDANAGAIVEAGAAYLFDGNSGALLQTFVDPTPADDEQFGYAVAFLGNNVLVGAPFDNNGGTVYLFDSSNGVLIHTFNNPTPFLGDEFGSALASAGNNVLVGSPSDDDPLANSGAAHLFNGNTGSLIFTLLNPTPAISDAFGNAVATSGNDLVVAARLHDETGALNAGAVYLFSGATGVLLRTIANPAPAGGDQFGSAVAGIGSSGLILIGTHLNDPPTDAGSAYLFNGATGALIQTINNPNPANLDNFGYSVAGIGNNVLIGTPNDDIGASDTGAAYLYTSPNEPPLAHAGADQTLECLSPAGIVVTLDGSASSDPDNDPLTYTWRESGNLIAGPTTSPTSLITFNLGTHTIELTVNDGNGGTDTDLVLIIVADTTPPTLSLNGASPMMLECHASSYEEPGAAVSDGCDPSPALTTSGTVNPDATGAYTITYTAIDASGNQAIATRIVNVVDSTPPEITLTGANPLALACDTPYSEPGAVVSDACNPSPGLVITGTVNHNVPGTYTITYTASDGSGNSSSATRSVNVECPLPYPFVLLAKDKVIIDRALASEGDIHSNDDIEFREGKPSTHTGNLTAVEDIQIKKFNTIDGDVTAGGSLALEGNSTITGTATSHATVAPFPLPTFNFTDGQNNVTVPANGSLSLAPGSYHDVKVEIGGNLLLSHNGSSGQYFLHKLDVKTFGRLSLDVSQGPVEINLVQKFHFEKDVEVNIAPATEASSRLVTFNVKDNDEIHIHDRSNVAGTVNAPKSKVILFEAVFFKGAVSGKEIQVLQNVTCLHHSSSGSAPLSKTSPLAAEVGEECSQNEIATEVKTNQLGQNYPNPFNPETRISYTLKDATEISLEILDLSGGLVATLVNALQPAGRHEVSFDAKDLAGGIYFYRLQTPSFTQTKRMLLLK